MLSTFVFSILFPWQQALLLAGVLNTLIAVYAFWRDLPSALAKTPSDEGKTE